MSVRSARVAIVGGGDSAFEEALFIMVQSYEKLELPALRDAADRVLRQNFPNSAFLGGNGLSANARPWWKFW